MGLISLRVYENVYKDYSSLSQFQVATAHMLLSSNKFLSRIQHCKEEILFFHSTSV